MRAPFALRLSTLLPRADLWLRAFIGTVLGTTGVALLVSGVGWSIVGATLAAFGCACLLGSIAACSEVFSNSLLGDVLDALLRMSFADVLYWLRSLFRSGGLLQVVRGRDQWYHPRLGTTLKDYSQYSTVCVDDVLRRPFVQMLPANVRRALAPKVANTAAEGQSSDTVARSRSRSSSMASLLFGDGEAADTDCGNGGELGCRAAGISGIVVVWFALCWRNRQLAINPMAAIVAIGSWLGSICCLVPARRLSWCPASWCTSACADHLRRNGKLLGKALAALGVGAAAVLVWRRLASGVIQGAAKIKRGAAEVPPTKLRFVGVTRSSSSKD